MSNSSDEYRFDKLASRLHGNKSESDAGHESADDILAAKIVEYRNQILSYRNLSDSEQKKLGSIFERYGAWSPWHKLGANLFSALFVGLIIIASILFIFIPGLDLSFLVLTGNHIYDVVTYLEASITFYTFLIISAALVYQLNPVLFVPVIRRAPPKFVMLLDKSSSIEFIKIMIFTLIVILGSAELLKSIADYKEKKIEKFSIVKLYNYVSVKFNNESQITDDSKVDDVHYYESSLEDEKKQINSIDSKKIEEKNYKPIAYIALILGITAYLHFVILPLVKLELEEENNKKK